MARRIKPAAWVPGFKNSPESVNTRERELGIWQDVPTGKLIPIDNSWDEMIMGGKNVKSFGAKGDGVTDDTEALRNAAVDIEDGDTLFFPPGVYMHGLEMVFQNKDNFAVFGYGATLKSIDSTPVATNYGGIRVRDCTFFTIAGLKIDANRDNRTLAQVSAHSIYIVDRCTDFVFQDIRTVNAAVDGFTTAAADEQDVSTWPIRGTFLNCSSDNAYRQGMSITVGRQLQVIGGSYINTNGQNPQSGIDIEPNNATLAPGVRDISIVGVTLVDNAGFGILVTENSEHVRVVSCYFEGNDRGGIKVNESHECTISSNTFYLHDTADRAIIDVGPISNRVVVESNVIDNVETGFQGIYIQSNTTDCVVKDNILKDINLVAAAGDAITNFGDNTIIQGNIIRDTGDLGIGLGAGGDDCVVKDNVIHSTVGSAISDAGLRTKIVDNVCIDADMTGVESNGIIRATGADVQIRGNSVRLTTPDTGITGINATTTPSVVSENYVEGCSLTNDVVIGGDITANHIWQPVKFGDGTNVGFGAGPDVASAEVISLPMPFSHFRVTGTTRIQKVTDDNGYDGREVVLYFEDIIRIDHLGTGGTGDQIHLTTTLQDMIASAGDMLALRYDSDDDLWYEVWRSQPYVRTDSTGAGFQLEPSRMVSNNASSVDRASDGTTAISDGGITGQLYAIANTGTARVVLQEGANTAFTGSMAYPVRSKHLGVFFFDGTNWVDAPFSLFFPANGTFTMTAAASDVVVDPNVHGDAAPVLVPTNAAAATLQAGASGLYISETMCIEIIDYTLIDDNETVTITTTTDNVATQHSTFPTEGDWKAETDNATSATNLAGVLNGYSGVTASATGAIISISGATIRQVSTSAVAGELVIGFQVSTADAGNAAGTETFTYTIPR